MTSHRGLLVPAAIHAVVQRVAADGAIERLPGFELLVDRDFSGCGDVDDAAHVVGVVGGRRFAAGLERGIEECCATVMSALQDEVVDNTGQPWPAIAISGEGTTVRVLDVDIDTSGIAVWRLGDEVVCTIGHLIPSVRARDWTLREHLGTRSPVAGAGKAP